MKSAQKVFLLGACAAVLVVQQRSSPRRSERRKLPEREDLAAAPSLRSAKSKDLPYGISIGADALELVDWSGWMEHAPEMIRATLDEGSRDPHEIVANMFRRLFPQHPWPPPENSPLHSTWNDMVAAVGRSLELPFKPHLEIVS